MQKILFLKVDVSSFPLKETSRGSILVKDHLPLATALISFSSSSAASVGTCFGSWAARIDLPTKAPLHYVLKFCI